VKWKLLASTIKAVNPVQPLNAELPMEVKPAGSVTDVNPLQFPNDPCPMEVKPAGRFSVPVNPLQ
jgi:hypothetical protein